MASIGRTSYACRRGYNTAAFSTKSEMQNLPKGSQPNFRPPFLFRDNKNNERTAPVTTTITTNATTKRSRLDDLREQLLSDDTTTSPSFSSFKKTPPQTTSSKTKLQSWEQILSLAQKKHSLKTLSPQEILTDSFQRHHTYLRISLSERCNLRCQYCMPPDGVPLQANEKLLTDEEIVRLIRLFRDGGVDKLRLTGGEPLLRPNLSGLLSSITTLSATTSHLSPLKTVGITTNGLTLSRQLPSLIASGLTHVNISLDTLHSSKFLEITRRKGLNQVLSAIDTALTLLPKQRVKINCVVMKGFNDNELRDFVMLTRDRAVDVRFIEWMPFSNNGWNQGRFLSFADMLSTIVDGSIECNDTTTTRPPLELKRMCDGPNDTTKWYQVPTHSGRVGFITSMSQHFCGTCNRLRITADGQLKACLFGSAEVSLRDAMRAGVSDLDLKYIVKESVEKKNWMLGGHSSAEDIRQADDNRPMTLIGG